MMMTERPPMPLEWHPDYADKPWLMDWLEGRSGVNRNMIVFPADQELKASWGDPGMPVVADLPRTTMTMKRAAGPAPFVGDSRWQRGWYEWNIGVDDEGRSIAGEAHLRIERTF